MATELKDAMADAADVPVASSSGHGPMPAGLGPSVTREVTVHRKESEFGFNLVGTSPIYIQFVAPNGPAEVRGGIS